MKCTTTKKIVVGGISLTFLLLLLGGYYCYDRIARSPNYNISGEEPVRLNVYPEDTWADVYSILEEKASPRYSTDLEYLVNVRDSKLRYGSYLVTKGMTTLELYRILVGGRESAIKLRFNSVRTPEDLYEAIGRQLMIGTEGVKKGMEDSIEVAKYDSTQGNFAYLVLPNTYEVYWSISSAELIKRLHKEYSAFWTSDRLSKASALGLSSYEVTTLASIVQEESAKIDEYATIAGLYLNRLKIGMPLQADPTVKYAVGDFTLRRILHEHLKVESPYNTYIHKGLPPTPIRIPSIQAIDGVLNAKNHPYLYMCAKEDFSGYHNFATSYTEHLANARRYTSALNARNIK